MGTDIFLSYAREDASKAMELARILEADGWTVWWDREIAPGQDFELEIDMALANARAVVVLWSAFSVSSNWVRNEAREAKELNKLIPVQLDDSRIPLTYRSLSSVDLRQWPDQPALVEISMFKSAVSRVLLKGVSDQMLKKPAAAEEMTLSVRVASRVAEMVASDRAKGQSVADSAPQLAIERCIADICLDMLARFAKHESSTIDVYLRQLGTALRAEAVIRARVDFSRMSVSELLCDDGNRVTAAREKLILDYTNQYCSPTAENNLQVDPGSWPLGLALCMPLSEQAGGREFVWFIADSPLAEWTQDLQERLQRLAQGIKICTDTAR